MSACCKRASGCSSATAPMFSAQRCSQDPCHLHISRSSGRKERSPARRDCEVGDEPEMVAGPHTVDRFVEDPRASCNFKCRSSVLPTTHKDVVDSPEWPVPIPQQSVINTITSPELWAYASRVKT